MKKNKVPAILELPKRICIHLIGKDHKTGHQVLVGAIFMIVGVVITKWATIYFSSEIIKCAGDIVGYSIHGIGLTPIIEIITKLDK